MAYIRSASQVDITNGVSVDTAVSPKNLKDNVWFFSGNTVGETKTLGTVDDYDLPIIRNSVERMRLSSYGVIIGTSGTTSRLEVDSGVANTSGIRMLNLSPTSTLATGSTGTLGVDSSGYIVRIPTPSFDGMETFNVAADSGTTQTISNNNTLSILGGTGIDTAVGAVDTVTVSLNASLNDLSDVVIASASTNQILQYNGTNWVNTAFSNDIQTVTTNTTLTQNDYMILVNNSGPVTISLPSAASSVRKEYVIKKITPSANGAVTIDPNGSELIDGASTYAIASSYVSVKIKSDGTALYIH
jgi:hypothetical protein